MTKNDEVLLFLPSWNILDAEQLSSLLESLRNEVLGNQELPVTIAIVSLDEDQIMPYQHRRVKNSVLGKEEVMDLLIRYEVSRIPFSIIRTIGRTTTSSNNENDSSSTVLSAVSSAVCDSTGDNENENNTGMVHIITPPSSSPPPPDNRNTAPTPTASDHFTSAMEAYDNFNFPAAAAAFHSAILLDPSYKSALFNFAGLLHMFGYACLAVGYIEKVLLLDKEDMIAHSFLWAVTQLKDVSLIGIDSYRRLSHAGDIKASQKLAALTGEGELAMKGDPKYAQRIYDDMGCLFEGKLVTHLGYRGPWDLFEMMEGVLGAGGVGGTQEGIDGGMGVGVGDREGGEVGGEGVISNGSADTNDNHHDDSSKKNDNNPSLSASPRPPKGQWRILDLGCGSGLVGKVFREYVFTDSVPGNNVIGGNEEVNRQKDGEKDGEKDEEKIEKIEKKQEGSIIEESDSNRNDNNDKDVGKENEQDEEEKDRISFELLTTLSHTPGPLMAGIDVSIRMVDIARGTGCYSGVVRMDLNEALKAFQSTCGDDNDNDCNNAGNDGDNDNSDDDNRNDNNNGGDESNNSNNNNGKNVAIVKNNSRIPPKVPLDLIIAADTFIYIGTLGAVFQRIRCCLSENGLFLFSIEDLERSPMRVEHQKSLMKNNYINGNAVENKIKNNVNGNHNTLNTGNKENNENNDNIGSNDKEENDTVIKSNIIIEPVRAVPGWGGQLLKSARFAHSNSYIEVLSQIHGFRILQSKSVVLRTEETVPLYGILYVLEAI